MEYNRDVMILNEEYRIKKRIKYISLINKRKRYIIESA